MDNPDKLIVFVDYQNAYMGAREAFYSDDAHYTCGQFDPLKLGNILVNLNNAGREDGGSSILHQVRLYCGLPDSRKDPKGNGSRLRQIQGWGRMPGVVARHRPLRYPSGFPARLPQEKGVDVQLAVDVIRMALQEEYQRGIIFSRDTDLIPVLETMLDLYPRIGVTCDVASWQADKNPHPGLRIPHRKIVCHYVTSNQFRSIEDRTDYRKEPTGYIRPSWG